MAKECRVGCGTRETLYHVSQQCFRSHGQRIARHYNIVKYLKKNLLEHGFTVTAEPRIKVNNITLKPDILAVKDGDVVVLDFQIVTDSRELNKMNNDKINKYNREDLLNHIRHVIM